VTGSCSCLQVDGTTGLSLKRHMERQLVITLASRWPCPHGTLSLVLPNDANGSSWTCGFELVVGDSAATSTWVQLGEDIDERQLIILAILLTSSTVLVLSLVS
jgi:hypothetical protein